MDENQSQFDENGIQLASEPEKQRSIPPMLLIGIAGVVVVLIIVFVFVIDFGGDKNSEQAGDSDIPDVATGDFIIKTKDSVLRSVDGGETFEEYFDIVASKQIGAADVLSISFHPLIPDRIIVTTYDDGLFLNSENKNEWNSIDFPPEQIYSFILDQKSPDDRIFASGVIDQNGRIFRSENAGENWRVVYAEPGVKTYISALAQHPKDPDIMLAGSNTGTVIKSLDGGNTWKNVGEKIDGNLSTFTFDSTNRSFVYSLSYKNKIYHSYNGGNIWLNWEEEKEKEVKALREDSRDKASELSKRNKDNRAPKGIVYILADPRKSGTIYAGTVSGLYRSTDFGKYWYKLNIIESAENFPIPSIAINKNDSDEIIFVAGKTFYKSTNRGDTWAVAPLDNSRSASFVAYDPFNSMTIFVGTSGK